MICTTFFRGAPRKVDRPGGMVGLGSRPAHACATRRLSGSGLCWCRYGVEALTIGDAMAGLAPGSRDDFATWVEPYVPALNRYATRLVGPDDRDDVVQEALIRAW